MGNSPKTIADMLTLNLTDVEVVLQSKNLLKKAIVNSLPVIVHSNPSDTSNTLAPNLEAVDINISAQKMYEDSQKRIASRIIELAECGIDEMMPASVVLKAAMYVNEEATGRNDARAKKTQNALLGNMAEFLNHLALAKTQVDRSLGISSDPSEPVINI